MRRVNCARRYDKCSDHAAARDADARAGKKAGHIPSGQVVAECVGLIHAGLVLTAGRILFSEWGWLSRGDGHGAGPGRVG